MIPLSAGIERSVLTEDSNRLYASLWLMRWLHDTAVELADALDEEWQELEKKNDNRDNMHKAALLFQIHELLTFDEYIEHKIKLVTEVYNEI